MASTTLKIPKERKPRITKPKIKAEGEKPVTKRKSKSVKEPEKVIEKAEIPQEVLETPESKPNKLKIFKDKIISFFKGVF